jgi:hypothetical protein
VNSTTRLLILSLAITCLFATQTGSQIAAQESAVRNDAPRVGQQEIVMMRHAYLEPGGYERWYRNSSEGVWPWFERIGAIILGDFQVIYPVTASETPEREEALRFARYASYEHWQSTRGSNAENSGDTGGSTALAGNGPLLDGNNAALADRRQVLTGSKEAVFMQGYMAETRPVFRPGTNESFNRVRGSQGQNDSDPMPVRYGTPEPQDEILVLQYRKIKKGTFEEVHLLSRNGTWPYLEKIGARPVGQWKIVYVPYSTPVESDDYDEIYTLTRFASLEHYQAVQENAVTLGGDGPDYDAAVDSFQRVNAFTQESSVRFMKGPLWGSPPIHIPTLDERYQAN